MSIREITFVGEHLELYARVDDETKEPVQVYWNRHHDLPVELDSDQMVPASPKDNPLFVQADDPKMAFLIALRDYNVTSEDEQWLNETFPNRCRWFMRCQNTATSMTPHPILGEVPTCERCKRFAAE